MKCSKSILLYSIIFVSLSTCKSKNIETQTQDEVKSITDDTANGTKTLDQGKFNKNEILSNINLNESHKGPVIQLLTNVEGFIESSIHSVVQDFFLKNNTLNDRIASVYYMSLNGFHDLSEEIKRKGDDLFNRQEKIIHLIQCECPDYENKCNHILEQENPVEKRDDESSNITPEENDSPPPPFIDVLQLVTHFQNHFINVLRTQRKVFDYATCACPTKRECMVKKAKENGHGKSFEESNKNTLINERKMINSQSSQTNDLDESKRIKRNTNGATESDKDENGKGFFSDIFQWFSHIFSGGSKSTTEGTTLFNGTFSNGAQYTGGEFHNGNINGYFITTHNNDSTGNFYSASSAGGGTFSNFGR